MRVLVAEAVAEEGIELLRAEHDVDVRVGLPREELVAALPDYDGLLVRSQVKVDAEAIAAGRRLVVIGRAGVGVDNIDLAAATAAGIIVVNAPTGNTIAAAEHTLALLFALARRIPAADASMHRGEWKRADFVGHELDGQHARRHRPREDRDGRRRSCPRPRHAGRRLRPVRDRGGGCAPRHPQSRPSRRSSPPRTR